MIAGADPSNPQSWNGYSYVTNNPLSMIDPTGMDECFLPSPPDSGHAGTGPNPPPTNAQDCVKAYGTWVITNQTVTVHAPIDYVAPVITSPQWRSDAQPPFITRPENPGSLPQIGVAPAPPTLDACIDEEVKAGLKAAFHDLIPLPPQFNPDPASATGDLITSKPGQAATIAVLYDVANTTRFLTPAADAAADLVPYVGWAWATGQVIHALNAGRKAGQESYGQCHSGG